jgi:hypothetical protein
MCKFLVNRQNKTAHVIYIGGNYQIHRTLKTEQRIVSDVRGGNL